MTDVAPIPEVMPLEQAATMLGVHPRTLHRAADLGDLRISQIARRGGWVVQAADLRAFLELRATRPRERAAAPPPAPEQHARRARRRRPDGGRVVIDPAWGRT